MKRKSNFLQYIIVFALTFLSGALNVYTIRNFKIPITHHTGNASVLAMGIFNNNLSKTVLFVILAFLIGTIISGLIIHSKGKNSSKYSIILIIIGICILLEKYILTTEYRIMLLSTIAGIQNGFLININGITTRTTHITGYLTDLGISISNVLKGNFSHFKNVLFYFLSITLFISGGFFSVFLSDKNIGFQFVGIIYILLAIISIKL